jgi:hypothetical protein
MPYTLMIAEKPSAAKRIASALAEGGIKEMGEHGVRSYRITHRGKDIVVAPAVGHLFVLSEKKSGGSWTYPVFDVEWQPTFERGRSYVWSKKYFDNMIVTLSQGNKQKTMLIAAMLHVPKLLILDEPFSGLDVRTAKIMKDIVKIHTETGGAVLLSTHIMEVAQAMCDRVGILDDGKLVAVGSLEELRTQAHEEAATLESLFLRLTEQEDEVAEGVTVLREALAD